MLKNIDYSKILFFDIETVPNVYNYNELDKQGQDLWDKKTKFLQKRDEMSADEIYNMAGIYAEFGQVICISLGLVVQKNGENQIRLKSIAGKDEKKLLKEFINILDTYYNTNEYIFCTGTFNSSDKK